MNNYCRFYRQFFLLLIVSACIVSCNYDNKQQNNKSVVYVPLDWGAPCGIISLEAFINDTLPALFFVDTGGPKEGDIVMDSSFFFKNMDIAGFEKYISEDRHQEGWIVKDGGSIPITIGDNTFFINRVLIENYEKKYGEKYPYIGMIGEAPFLNKYTIFDLENAKIAFVDTLDVDSSYIAVPLRVNEHNHRLARISGLKDIAGKPAEGYFIFDTGCQSSGLHLKTSYAEDIRMDNPQKQGSSLYWRTDSIQIGEIVLNNVHMRKSTLPLNRNRFERLIDGDGLLGMPILFKFNMILDYRNNVLYLKPNKYFDTDYHQIFDVVYGG